MHSYIWGKGRRAGCYRTAYATSTIYVDAVPTGERAWWMQHVHSKTATDTTHMLGDPGYTTAPK